MKVTLKYSDTVFVNFYLPEDLPPIGVSFPFLEKVDNITVSTAQESGNARFLLNLQAFELLGVLTSRLVDIYDKNQLIFTGILTEMTLTNVITCQVEA